MKNFKNYEMGVVYRNTPRADAKLIAQLADCGVATISESMGRMGLMKPYMRSIYKGAKVVGNVVTVLLHPGDNWMLHVAAEQIQEGDIVVAAVSADCTDGFFGELLATSFQAQGAAGLIIDGGVRDIAQLEEMEFPVWSKSVSAKGTIKASLGSVNIPVLCAGALVSPGDVVAADDDGIVVIPRNILEKTVELSVKREENEVAKREKLASGILGLDMYQMREPLEKAGLRYIDSGGDNV